MYPDARVRSRLPDLATVWQRSELIRAMALVVGGLLLVSTYLKLFRAAESGALQAVYNPPRWLVIEVIQGELLLALLLFSGLWPRLAWSASLGLFSMFGLFSLHGVLAGYESCGCFGPVKVSPWFTFTLDVAVVLALSTFRGQWWREAPIIHGRKPFATVALYVPMGLGSLFFILSDSPGILGTDDADVVEQSLVILEPEQLVRGGFPLRRDLTPSVDISRGEWITLLYHHDCPKCQEALPRYEALADRLASHSQATSAVGRSASLCSDNSLAMGAATHTKLTDQREWFVQTPVEILIRDGEVKVASLELPSVANAD